MGFQKVEEEIIFSSILNMIEEKEMSWEIRKFLKEYRDKLFSLRYDYNFLSGNRFNENEETFGHILAKYGFNFPEDRLDILSLRDKNGVTIAHVMVKEGRYHFSFDKDNVLFLEDNTGNSVCYEMAKAKCYFPLGRTDILMHQNKNEENNTIAHVMASYGYTFPEERFDILSLENDNGTTVAHNMVTYGNYMFSEDNLNVLYLKDKNNWFTAHEMAIKGYYFDEKNTNILLLKDNEGISVSYLMAYEGYMFPTDRFEILFQDVPNYSVLYFAPNLKFKHKELNLNSLNIDSKKFLSEIKGMFLRYLGSFDIRKVFEKVFQILGFKKLKLFYELFKKYYCHEKKSEFCLNLIDTYEVFLARRSILDF